MSNPLSILSTPLGYLRISTASKYTYDVVIPIVLTVLFCSVVGLIPGRIDVFGATGLLHTVMGILQMLTGFYITALAAVATFSSDNIDKELDGSPAKLEVIRAGKGIKITLSRRNYVCYLFGYLSFVCLILYSVSVIATLVYPGLQGYFSANIAAFLRGIFVLIYTFVLSNLLVTTLIGLHYLTDRIHR